MGLRSGSDDRGEFPDLNLKSPCRSVRAHVSVAHRICATWIFSSLIGAHSNDYVRCNRLNVIKRCGPGGVIARHGFGWVGINGVSRCLRELSRSEQLYAIPGGLLAFMVVRYPAGV